MDKYRLAELDGLRGVAILMIIASHYFSRFPDFYPYPPLWSHGGFGVHLFFMVSGFVIAMTLSKSATIWEFGIRRFSRLWPAMLICSIITFIAMRLIDNPFTEFRRVPVIGFLPSLTFTTPQLWKWLFPSADYIDGAYWTMFVEIRFYFWAALLYFLTGSRRLFVICFFLFAAATWSVYAALLGLRLESLAKAWDIAFLSRHIALFAAGVLFHSAYADGYGRRKLLALLACLVAAIIMTKDLYGAFATTLFFGVFTLFIYRRDWLRPLRNPVILWIGLSSYSTYLLHQNIGVAIISGFDRSLPHAILYLMAFMTAAGVILTGIASFLLIEQRTSAIKRFLMRIVPRSRDRRGADVVTGELRPS
ncbi:MAG: acyltransferase family protein [Sphingobium sp.]